MHRIRGAAIGKMVSASEFDARFAQLIEQMAKDGQTVTITQDGMVVAELMPRKPLEPGSVIGMLRSPEYRSDGDHEAPATDLSDRDALRDDEQRSGA